MRGREHHVMTGVCVIRPLTLLKTCFYCVSSVYFGDYSDEELRRYVDTDEPYDKAGDMPSREPSANTLSELTVM